MNNKYIGENIKIYRERKKLTQRELGDKIGKTWEMSSRYERGESSPLKQLNNLADALNIDPRDLLRDSSSQVDNYSTNKIPYFTSIPDNNDFLKTKSYLFYPVPDWVLQIDINTFAVDMNIVDGSNGVVYISPNSRYEIGDTVLINDNGNLEIVKYRRNSRDIIGKVLAQEVRFV